jgi:hypothetical protein
MPEFFTPAEARSALHADLPTLARRYGIHLGAQGYMTVDALDDIDAAFDAAMAMDAQPGLITQPNGAIPALMTTLIDPRVIEVLTMPEEMGSILGESLRGNWTSQTAMFNLTEMTGEASSYADTSNNGRSGVNTNWPQRQAYLFQTNIEVGDLEAARASEAKMNIVAMKQRSAANTLNKAMDTIYAYGVKGLQNYGMLNDPALTASLTPGTKLAGGVAWMNGTTINATANEVFLDIQSLFTKVVNQAAGRVTVSAKNKMKLAMSPQSQVALTATNSFNVNVFDLLQKNFPQLTVETSMRYAALSASNPQGNAGGNIVQLIVEVGDGQETVRGGFNEKLRAHPVVRERSAWTQKWTSGSWGSILFRPLAVSTMIGV